ncbi:hypothetical protein [Silvanigrella sp.]|jgi:hypothetical protein|uniref:hypothetical protein n=1 Tax=Silvanigrella sp. TaxID=2024976 RepID=UPI0037CC2B32
MDKINFKQKLLKIENASDLPESFIENICKIALQQDKTDDLKWITKSILTASNRFKQQQEQKKEKELKQNIKNKKEVRASENTTIHDNEGLYQLIEQLPRVESFLKFFPKIEKIAFKYIINNHGLWTLKLLSVLREPNKIHTEWAVHFTFVLRFGFNIQKCVELNFHNEPDLMYTTVINSKEYLDSANIRKEYWKWKRKEKKRIFNEVKKRNENS